MAGFASGPRSRVWAIVVVAIVGLVATRLRAMTLTRVQAAAGGVGGAVAIHRWRAPAGAIAVLLEAAGRPETGCSSDERVEELAHARWIRHEVVPRETLREIAARYWVGVGELRVWNALPEAADGVRRGAKLRVKTRHVPPPRRQVDYTVREHDTWWRVALLHGVDVSDLRAYNWPYRDKMQPGSTLQIWVDPVAYAWIQRHPPRFEPPQELEIRRGGIGIGRPDAGRLIGGVPVPPGDGWSLRFPDSAYGTTHAVEQLVTALRAFVSTSSPARDLLVGTMSRMRGGPVGGHRSHQTGRDVDLRLPRRASVPRWMELVPSRVDAWATWGLLLALRSVDAEVVFLDYEIQRRVYRAARAKGVLEASLAGILQYPKGTRSAGFARHVVGHDKHLHVRFGCGPCEVACVEDDWADATD